MTLAEIDARAQEVVERLGKAPAGVRGALEAKLDISWIYHDNALEGLVLTFGELKAATDARIISDSTLIPAYDDIRNHRDAIALVREMSAKRKAAITLETLKKIHEVLMPDLEATEGKYRKDHPIHRQYFHEIASPDKISYKMRRLIDWVAGDEARIEQPVRRATKVHLRLMQIFPWSKNSGKIARLIMNLMLLRDGYPPAIIHAIDRQRYYESLRLPPGAQDEEDDDGAEALLALVVEALRAGFDSALRFVDEAKEQKRRARVA
ncbi:MAG: Fic family protein [Myxococcota bacterium]